MYPVIRKNRNYGLNSFDLLGHVFDEALGGRVERDTSFRPATNVKETKDAYELSFDLPGLEKNAIDISFKDGVLTVAGQRESEWKEDENETLHFEGKVYGQFSRGFSLPESVKADEVSATYRNGVLAITVPKADEVQPKRIEVK